MTLARNLSAVWSEITPQYSAYSVVQAPYNLTPISGQELAPVNLSGNVTVELRGEGAFNIQAALSVPASANFTSPSFNFTGPAARLRIRSSGAGNLTFSANFGLPVIVWADRRKAGVEFADQNVFFSDRFSHAQMPLRRVPGDNSSDYIVTMQLVVDRIVSELFVNNGSSTASECALPVSPRTLMLTICAPPSQLYSRSGTMTRCQPLSTLSSPRPTSALTHSASCLSTRRGTVPPQPEHAQLPRCDQPRLLLYHSTPLTPL